MAASTTGSAGQELTRTRRTAAAPARARLLVLAVVVAVAAGAVGSFSLSRARERTVDVATGRPVLVSEAQLERLSASVDHPVYWAGRRSGFSYEVTESGDGRIYVRYLPHGVRAGDPRARFLVVGTYARPHAYADLEHAANRGGSAWLRLTDGRLVLFASARPQNVYVGYPGAAWQVEVFSPSAAAARKLALAGEIRPIG